MQADIRNIESIPEYQSISGNLERIETPCFVPGCKEKAVVRVSIVLNDHIETQVIPCLCGKCAALDVDEIVNFFIKND